MGSSVYEDQNSSSNNNQSGSSDDASKKGSGDPMQSQAEVKMRA